MDNLSNTNTESSIVESSSKSEEDDALDPRVQIELERLNHANEAINHLELQLDEARTTLKELWKTSITELLKLEKTIGTAVSKARSYYDTRIKLRDAKEILTKTKHRFERAQALHVAAKELALVSIDYIDAGEKSGQNVATWNETYRHALVQAADAEREKYQADVDQQRAQMVYFDLVKNLEQLEKDFRRSINKSQPYYEMKAEYHKELEFQKRKVCDLEKCVTEAKTEYQQSLRNLEHISNEIHQQRNKGKTLKDFGERTSSVDKEQIVELDLSNAKLTPIVSQQNTLHSCLLRTESLPTGIITTSTVRYSPDNEEQLITSTTNNCNNQFILRSKDAPQMLTIVNNSEHNNNNNNLRRRVSSFSSHTTDEDDKTTSSSLHVLSDEQINHLAYEYHPYNSDNSDSTDPIDELLSQLENSTLQAKTFFRKLFKVDSS